jgi:hypothetical protein
VPVTAPAMTCRTAGFERHSNSLQLSGALS